MSTAAIILGESGTGKTSSLRNLDPKNTLLIQAIGKQLPFRPIGWSQLSKENKDGCIYVTDSSQKICDIIHKSKRKIIVVDDFQYTMANEFMRRVTDKESGNGAFQKYNEIAKYAWDIMNAAASAEGDKRVYILSHIQTDDFGSSKIKTIGKLLDDKIVLEGMVPIVLKTKKVDNKFCFTTRNSGSDTVKTPIGMFEDEFIENDLAAVDKAICEYYGI